jgi:hypothetical protein
MESVANFGKSCKSRTAFVRDHVETTTTKYLAHPKGGLEVCLWMQDGKKAPYFSVHPPFIKPIFPKGRKEDWCTVFLQRDGKPVAPKNPYLEGVYNMTALHADSEPPNCAWMVVLEGKKRFYLVQDSAQIGERDNNDPCFVSSLAVQVMNFKGLRVADLAAGDLICFPGQFYHEVHNLTPSSTAITNASVWPEEEKGR